MENIKNKFSNIFKITFLMLAFSALSNNNALKPKMTVNSLKNESIKQLGQPIKSLFYNWSLKGINYKNIDSKMNINDKKLLYSINNLNINEKNNLERSELKAINSFFNKDTSIRNLFKVLKLNKINPRVVKNKNFIESNNFEKKEAIKPNEKGKIFKTISKFKNVISSIEKPYNRKKINNYKNNYNYNYNLNEKNNLERSKLKATNSFLNKDTPIRNLYKVFNKINPRVVEPKNFIESKNVISSIEQPYNRKKINNYKYNYNYNSNFKNINSKMDNGKLMRELMQMIKMINKLDKNEKNTSNGINKLSMIKENEELIAREILKNDLNKKKNDQFNFKNTKKNINLNGNVNKVNIYEILKRSNKNKVNELNSVLGKINFDDIKKHEVNKQSIWGEIENLFEVNMELKTKYKNLHKYLMENKRKDRNLETTYELFKEKLVKKLESENGILHYLIEVFKNPEKLSSSNELKSGVMKNLILYNNLYAEKDLNDFMKKNMNPYYFNKYKCEPTIEDKIDDSGRFLIKNKNYKYDNEVYKNNKEKTLEWKNNKDKSEVLEFIPEKVQIIEGETFKRKILNSKNIIQEFKGKNNSSLLQNKIRNNSSLFQNKIRNNGGLFRNKINNVEKKKIVFRDDCMYIEEN